ncbi:hypothetical protein [uncultured Maribacter sp.]|uniref:hypothetical protein n=1 Tax=uncultured Maribacter sp. TaxID=431308 RepID=UPI002632B3A9|nr:hypothetical protein [uncultured Maribacter sp.]
MSFLKKIFGKTTDSEKDEFKYIGDNNDPKRDNKFKADLNKINSGEINEIFPILKPSDWIGIKAGALRQTIIGDKENPKLVVGFGYNAPNNFVFLNYSDYQERGKLEKMVEQAYDNLYKYEVTFNEVVPNKVIIIDGQDFCSEKILDTKFMKALQHKMGGEKLVVSIPRRRCMMVTNSFEEQGIFEQFMSVHKSTWENDSYGNAQIMNSLFVVKNGEIDMVKDL